MAEHMLRYALQQITVHHRMHDGLGSRADFPGILPPAGLTPRKKVVRRLGLLNGVFIMHDKA